MPVCRNGMVPAVREKSIAENAKRQGVGGVPGHLLLVGGIWKAAFGQCGRGGGKKGKKGGGKMKAVAHCLRLVR